jgi:hypothetical protein
MIISGHQPNYLPWLGFFDKMQRSDLFIIEDNVQFERQGFANRNRIKTVDGIRWLSVPIEHTNKPLLIKEVKIANEGEPRWKSRHWLMLRHSYCKAPYWLDYCDFFKNVYEHDWTMLIDLNLHLIKGIMSFLGIETPLIMASSLNVSGKKSDLVLAKCKTVGADILLVGDGAKDYLEVDKFEKENIKVVFQNFEYPIYSQCHGEFSPNLSVVDYLFCVGSKDFKKQVRRINI